MNLSDTMIDSKPCEMCGKPEGNHLLCDRCDRAYHQECLAQDDMPGDSLCWFCKPCLYDIREHNEKDIIYDLALTAFLHKKEAPKDPAELSRVEAMEKYFEVVNGQLYAKPMGKHVKRRAVPSMPERDLICREAHENLGHCGRDKMLAYLKRKYWWKNMAATVEATTRTCLPCQK